MDPVRTQTIQELLRYNFPNLRVVARQHEPGYAFAVKSGNAWGWSHEKWAWLQLKDIGPEMFLGRYLIPEVIFVNTGLTEKKAYAAAKKDFLNFMRQGVDQLRPRVLLLPVRAEFWTSQAGSQFYCECRIGVCLL